MAGGRTTRVYPGPCGCCGGGCGCPACGGTLPDVLHVTFQITGTARFGLCPGLWPGGDPRPGPDLQAVPVTFALACTGTHGEWATGVELCRYGPPLPGDPAPPPGARGTFTIALTCDPDGGGGFQLRVGGVTPVPPGGASSQYDWEIRAPYYSGDGDVYYTPAGPWTRPTSCDPFVLRFFGGAIDYAGWGSRETSSRREDQCCNAAATTAVEASLGNTVVTL